MWVAALTAAFRGLLGLHGNPLWAESCVVKVKCFVQCLPFVSPVGALG